MRPSLRQIDAFLAVAELGNFSRAAERLGASQPALSQSVRELEEGLALRLLDRTTRRVELTEAGRAFRDQAAKGVEELDRALRHARDLAGLRRGHLRVAAPPLMATAVLTRALAAFASKHPGISFELADIHIDEIVARIRAGRTDLGVGTFPPGDPDLDRRPVLRHDLMLFCPEAHPLARRPCRWADLAGAAMVTLTRTSGIRLLTEIGFERAGLALRPAFEVTQVATALALVEAGMGVAVLPSYTLAASGRRGVKGQVLSEPTLGREVVIVSARDRSLSPTAQSFADHLARSIRDLAPNRPEG